MKDRIKTKSYSNYYPIYSIGSENVKIFGATRGKYHQFEGRGQVIKISRGDKMDIVDVKFGMYNKIRPIVVTNSLARRQILTLKRGQWADFGGEAKMLKFRTKDGKHTYNQWCFYAYDIQGHYVPKMFDVKKLQEDIDNGEETNQIDDLTQSKEKFYQDVVDGLFGELVNVDESEVDNGKDD